MATLDRYGYLSQALSQLTWHHPATAHAQYYEAGYEDDILFYRESLLRDSHREHAVTGTESSPFDDSAAMIDTSTQTDVFDST